jgi:hypothetical protein
MRAGGDRHETAINPRCRETIGSHGQASNATRVPCDMQGGRCAPTSKAHPGLGHFRTSSHLIRSLSASAGTLAVSYHSFVLFCPSLLRFAAFFISSHISRLRFPACSCLFPKHAQRPAPAFSTFQLAAAPDYAADTHTANVFARPPVQITS